VTDSIPVTAENRLEKMEILTVSGLLGEAIKRIHHDQSISAIFPHS
jgi:ribose-phosphate pyrophosphokinase